MTPSVRPSCDICKYCVLRARPRASPMDSGKNECRRYAPRVISGTGTGWSNDIFPFVNDGDWCGEFINRLPDSSRGLKGEKHEAS